jgi:hypothetical protein
MSEEVKVYLNVRKIQQASPHIKIHLAITLRYNKPLLASRYTSPLR